MEERAPPLERRRLRRQRLRRDAGERRDASGEPARQLRDRVLRRVVRDGLLDLPDDLGVDPELRREIARLGEQEPRLFELDRPDERAVVVEGLGVLALHASQEIEEPCTRLHLLRRSGRMHGHGAKRAYDQEQGEAGDGPHRN